jgi:hypothetical protein
LAVLSRNLAAQGVDEYGRWFGIWRMHVRLGLRRIVHVCFYVADIIVPLFAFLHLPFGWG